MSAVAKRTAGVPATFRPEEAKQDQAKIDALIDYAKALHDWPLLHDAIAAKIEQQEEFCRWWTENVRRAGQGNVAESATFLSAERAEELTGIDKRQVSRWRNLLKDLDKYREKLRAAAYRKAELEAAENHRAEGTGENEWFTPAKYLDAARAVMGAIDLDPATHPVAQEAVQAGGYFTRVDNGLEQEWYGNVWLNPPYAQPEIRLFVDKLVEEFVAGHVIQAILLTHNYTDTAWFHNAQSAATAICFTRGRIRFVDIDGEDCSPTQGQAFFYFGANAERFAEVFREFGFVVRPW